MQSSSPACPTTPPASFLNNTPQALSRQGCHRTALEVCKLMLALEPEDPMGALMMVDYLALRAGVDTSAGKVWKCGRGRTQGMHS